MKRELVPTTIRTEFGEVIDDPAFYETMGAAQDHTYVPGYSDIRRARDLQKGLRVAEHDATSNDEGIAARGRANVASIGETIRKSLDAAGMTIKGAITSSNVPMLPVRCQWARTSKILSGNPDNAKTVDYESQDYRFVTQADVGAPWLRALPKGATVQADGSIKKGDTTLMVCDAKSAARQAVTNAKMVERQQRDVAQVPLRNSAPESQLIFESAPGPAISAPPSRVK